MDPLVVPELEAYALAHTAADGEVYDRLREETYDSTDIPQMQVGRLEGRFLKLLVQICGAKRAVEVGTFTGYSSLSIAEGLPEGGRLFTHDIDEVTTAIARRYWAQVPWGNKIELRLGPAAETLAALDGPIDFAFIDADKEGYIAYWEILVPKMRPGGLIAADNVLWSGRVLNPSSESDYAVVAFNQHVLRDPRVEQVLVTVRDGITLARVL